jgi:hypothetical protein
MKFVEPRPFADPEAAARKLMELAQAFEPVQDGRIHIEKINGLYQLKARLPNTRPGVIWLAAANRYVCFRG